MISKRKNYPIRKKRSFESFISKTAFFLLAFGMLCILKVWLKVQNDQMLRKNGELRSTLGTLKYENALLEAKVEELKKMDRITDIAKNKIGLGKVPVYTMDLGSFDGH